jgi:hypothetical protein
MNLIRSYRERFGLLDNKVKLLRVRIVEFKHNRYLIVSILRGSNGNVCLLWNPFEDIIIVVRTYRLIRERTRYLRLLS